MAEIRKALTEEEARTRTILLNKSLLALEFARALEATGQDANP